MHNQQSAFTSGAKMGDANMGNIKHWPTFIRQKKRRYQNSEVVYFVFFS